MIKDGDFNAIPWSNGTYYLQVELDINSTFSFVNLGLTQLLSVPYALHSASSAYAKNAQTAQYATQWTDGIPVVQSGKIGSGAVLPNVGKGAKLIWYPRKAAFRAGNTDSQWDEVNIGAASFATGEETTACGSHSSAFGSETIAHGAYSTAFGSSTLAKGFYSTSLGMNTIAMGVASLAMGRFNQPDNAKPYLPDSEDYIFMIGNGTDELNRSNAFTVLRSGDAHLSGSLQQNSDRRLKRNFSPLTESLSKLTSLQGYHYFWKDTLKDQTIQTGLIAQEVETLFPELVKTDQKGFKSVNYVALVPHLIEAIKELEQANDVLKKHNQKIEMEAGKTKDAITALEARLNQLQQKFTADPSKISK